jgi:hypothetical protein
VTRSLARLWKAIFVPSGLKFATAEEPLPGPAPVSSTDTSVVVPVARSWSQTSNPVS